MSAKITVVTLDGRNGKYTRVRAQRLVDSGRFEWRGSRTVQETIPEQMALADRIVQQGTMFDPNYFYPEHQAHPEMVQLPWFYPPLSEELMKCYRTSA